MDWSFYHSTDQEKKEISEGLHTQGDGKGAKKSSSMDWLLYKSVRQGKDENCEGRTREAEMMINVKRKRGEYMGLDLIRLLQFLSICLLLQWLRLA